MKKNAPFEQLKNNHLNYYLTIIKTIMKKEYEEIKLYGHELRMNAQWNPFYRYLERNKNRKSTTHSSKIEIDHNKMAYKRKMNTMSSANSDSTHISYRFLPEYGVS